MPNTADLLLFAPHLEKHTQNSFSFDSHQPAPKEKYSRNGAAESLLLEKQGPSLHFLEGAPETHFHHGAPEEDADS